MFNLHSHNLLTMLLLQSLVPFLCLLGVAVIVRLKLVVSAGRRKKSNAHIMVILGSGKLYTKGQLKGGRQLTTCRRTHRRNDSNAGQD